MRPARPTHPARGTEVPSAARVYDYLLGGSAHFWADQQAAAQLQRAVPSARTDVLANRAFLRRTVNYLVDQGVQQLIDLGSGLPTVGNVHEVAHAADPDARVVYVDCDPVAVAYATRLVGELPGVAVIEADLRDVDAVLNSPETRRLLDFTQPLGLLAVAVMHFVSDCDDPIGVLDAYTNALVPSSHLVISHATPTGLQQAQAAGAADVYADTASPLTLRTPDQVAELFARYRLVPPADDLPAGVAPVVPVAAWRPDPLEVFETQTVFGGVGILPGPSTAHAAAPTC